ncbi:MAG: chemotaxis protein CheX [Phycisphaerales bacterium]
MTQLTADRLAELVAQSLESTAFIMSDSAHADLCAFAGATRGAVIGYSGPEEGTITLVAGDDFVRTLASNLLGVEAEEVCPSTQGEDALRELANIVGGCVIAELGGKDRSLKLSLPQTSVSAGPLHPAETAVVCCLNCEGHPLLVTWTAGPARAAA